MRKVGGESRQKKHIHKNDPPKPLPTKRFRARRRNFCEYLYLHMSGAPINLHPIIPLFLSSLNYEPSIISHQYANCVIASPSRSNLTERRIPFEFLNNHMELVKATRCEIASFLAMTNM